MTPVLARFWLNPSGRLSLEHYRLFLVLYVFVHLPLFTAIYLAFLVLGSRGSNSLFQTEAFPRIAILTGVFIILALWPMMVASLKRLHDLGLRGRDYFFSFNPVRNFRLGIRLISEPGPASADD